MIDASWLLFIVASLALIATPGQDMILVMSRSVAQGAAAGAFTAAGVSVGLLGHTVLATLGLGAILRTSELLFLALEFVGAAYLLYLGIGLLSTKRGSLAIGPETARPLGKLFLNGAFSNLSNPTPLPDGYRFERMKRSDIGTLIERIRDARRLFNAIFPPE